MTASASLASRAARGAVDGRVHAHRRRGTGHDVLRAQRRAARFLVELGQLARDGGRTVAQDVGHVRERGGEPRAGLVEDERRRNARELGELSAAAGLLGGQEASEQEPVGRQSRGRERGGSRADPDEWAEAFDIEPEDFADGLKKCLE